VHRRPIRTQTEAATYPRDETNGQPATLRERDRDERTTALETQGMPGFDLRHQRALLGHLAPWAWSEGAHRIHQPVPERDQQGGGAKGNADAQTVQEHHELPSSGESFSGALYSVLSGFMCSGSASSRADDLIYGTSCFIDVNRVFER